MGSIIGILVEVVIYDSSEGWRVQAIRSVAFFFTHLP